MRRLTTVGLGAVSLGLGLSGALVSPASAEEPAELSGPGTTLISASATGEPANAYSDRPQINGDGRYVTFDSFATNLIDAPMTDERHVFRKDLVTGEVVPVNVSNDGRIGQKFASFSWPSDDGNLVAFAADEDLTGDLFKGRAVYVRDIAAGTTELVSRAYDGKSAAGASSRPMISSDGRFVAFSSNAANLTPDAATSEHEQVFLRDRVEGTTTLVSVSGFGAPGNDKSYRGMVSDDGRYVAWASAATNLVPDGGPFRESIFVRDMETGTTSRVTTNPDGTPGIVGGGRPHITPDGRYVSFNSFGAYVPEDTNGDTDAYVKDLVTGEFARVSEAPGHTDGNDLALRAFTSDDGAWSVFNSFSGNLAGNDRNANGDVFLRENATATSHLMSMSWSGGPTDGQSYRPVFSNDASTIAYMSEAKNLVRGYTPDTFQIYAIDTDRVLALGADETAPTTAPTSPAAGDALPSTEPVVLAGTAVDDRAIEKVFVQVIDNGTGLWLREDGTWGEGARRLAADLDTPGEREATYAVGLDLPPGSYGYDVVAYDAFENKSTDKQLRTFTVVDGVVESVPPSVAVTSPTWNATLPTPVTLQGTASDNTSLASVLVQVRDNATGLWLREDGTFGPGSRRLPATVTVADSADGPDGTEGTTEVTAAWSLPLEVPEGSYGFDVVARDNTGNVSTKPWTRFTVSDTPPDTTAPALAVTAPAQGSTVQPPVVLTGTATDEVGVEAVYVQVRDNGTGQWLRPDGTWGDGARRITATLDGETWTLPADLPDGRYGFDAVAFDAAGNRSAKPWTGFTVSSTPPDTTAPELAVLAPEKGSTVEPPVVLTGTATDDTAVESVAVQVRDNGTGQWLRTDGTWGDGSRRIAAEVDGDTWTLAVDLPDGAFGFDAVALDAAGNRSAKPWTTFRVSALGPDTVAPTIDPTTPESEETLEGPVVTFSGDAADDRVVDTVFVQVRDNATGLWLHRDGTWGEGARRLPTVLDTEGATSTTWSLDTTLGEGFYGWNVAAFDRAGNKSAQPWHRFRVGAPPS